MGVQLHWEGLDELRVALQSLPAVLTSEAGTIVTTAAESAYQTLNANLPTGPTGNLKRRLTVSHDTSRAGAVAVVSSRAPHAWMFEHGTSVRRTRTGANRGLMPAASLDRRVVAVAMRARLKMYDALSALVASHGFEVSR